jgi:peptidoglycan/xylan/chitin deacetylase (PgdA/CDA1 family)
MWNGKRKAVTFSYDDGITQDKRLIKLLNRYDLKATFNLNTEKLGEKHALWLQDRATVAHCKFRPEEVRAVYEGHEIAGHTLNHPNLTKIEEDAEVIRQVEEDRIRLSELAGYEVVGFAYPCGGVNCNERVADLIRRNTGVRYARTIISNHAFDPQPDLFLFNPTASHMSDKLFRDAETFLAMETDSPKLFYVWGHSYELDLDDTWDRFEEFCRLISGKQDIFYGTNKEVLLS